METIIMKQIIIAHVKKQIEEQELPTYCSLRFRAVASEYTNVCDLKSKNRPHGTHNFRLTVCL